MGGPIYVNINPNKIKIDYTSNGKKDNLHYDSSYLNINTWYFGIDVNRPYGPSSGTGWYQGIDNRTIDDVLYTIYYTGSTIGNTGNSNDKYRCVQYDNEQDVINFVDQFVNPAPATFAQALNFFKDDGSGTSGGKGSTVCVNMNYPNIPTDNLRFALDAGHVASYPWINPTWYDFTRSSMSGFSGNSAIISNFNNGSLYFGFTAPTQMFIDISPPRQLGNTFTLIFWAKPNYVEEGRTPILLSCAPTIVSPLNQSVGFYNTGGDVYFYYEITDSSGSPKTRIGANILDVSIWHQFVYVFAPDASPGKSNISFYVDGVLNETNQESFTPAAWSPTGPNWTIGQSSPTTRTATQYIGGLQVMLVYERVLSDQEIADIYQNYFDTRGLFAP